MGRKEEPLVEYYNNPVHFAELVNGWIFDGKNYLNPENISDADRRTSQKSGRGAGKKEYRQQYRDILKQAGEWNVRGISYRHHKRRQVCTCDYIDFVFE